jgi:hypothetical protein
LGTAPVDGCIEDMGDSIYPVALFYILDMDDSADEESRVLEINRDWRVLKTRRGTDKNKVL